MRNYSRSPPQDITWNAAPSFENPASGGTTIANPEVTNTIGFSPALTYPYAQPSNFNQMVYPVSTQRLVVHRRIWLTLSRYRTCSRLGPRQCQRLVGRIFSSATVWSSHKVNQSLYRWRFRTVIVTERYFVGGEHTFPK